jgi:pimeloyl-ACP methyl ester carboxylesterase
MDRDLPQESHFLTTGNFNIHYIRQGTGPPLIHLHGGGTWLYSFRHNIDDLSKHFSVFAPDLPGHGFTKIISQFIRYDFNTICQMLIEFMDAVKIETANFAGHSWGGGWAIHFAHRHPERVSKLVLIDSSGIHRREHLFWELMKFPLIGEFLLKLINPYIIKKGLQDSFYNTSFVTPDMVRHIHEPLRIEENRKALLGYLRNVDWRETQAALPNISAPAFVIWGNHDRYIHVNFGKQTAELMPNARLIVLENCGHSAHEEQPKTVNRLMINFLKNE